MSEPDELSDYTSISSNNPTYHKYVDDSCLAPHLHHHTGPWSKNISGCDDNDSFSPMAKAIFAGIIAFIYIFLFVWIADRYGPMAAGIFGSIPGVLLAAVFFTEEKRKAPLVFSLILGGIAAILAAVIFYVLIKDGTLDKYTIFCIAIIVWLITILSLFGLFRDKIEENPKN